MRVIYHLILLLIANIYLHVNGLGIKHELSSQIMRKIRTSILSIAIMNPFSASHAMTDPASYVRSASMPTSAMLVSEAKDISSGQPDGIPGTGSLPSTGSVTKLDDEAEIIFRKGRQLESNGEYFDAQKCYEQVIEAEPTYVYAWSGLGNVLTAQGNLDEALLCYRKSLSLAPPKEEKAIVLLNKAAIEVSINRVEDALIDLNLAQRSGCSEAKLAPLRAVVYSNIGDWKKANEIFNTVISTSDRDALPWWLRYSMSLLETSRAMEAVAFLQRTINRYPYIEECNAFATALYSFLGSPLEARRYWDKISVEEQSKYKDDAFLQTKLHWGDKSRQALKSFLGSMDKQAIGSLIN
jgi:tetratricopeptide (TPR) repeat protein